MFENIRGASYDAINMKVVWERLADLYGEVYVGKRGKIHEGGYAEYEQDAWKALPEVR